MERLRNNNLFFLLLIISCLGLNNCNIHPIDKQPGEKEEETKPEPDLTPEEQFRKNYLTYIDEIPVMRINTGGVQVTSREDYINAIINIEGSQKYNKKDWAVEIRGRGNSTWDMPKKPYRIKAVSKTSIFGRPAVKNWALIANYSDKSLIRNYVVSMLGRSIDSLAFTPNAIFVEVYFNGTYEGLYCLQDHIEAKPSRVDVENFKTDGKGNLIETGFLLEIDWPDRNPGCVSGRDYFTLSNGMHFFLKYPKYDDDGFENPAFYQQAFDYIKNYTSAVHNAIISHDKITFNNLCNRDSFIDYLLVSELSKNVDGAQLSIFMNRKTGGKMNMGPLWDYDLALGNADYPTSNQALPIGWYLVNREGYSQLPWYKSLMTMNDFYEDFRTRYIELSDTNIKYAFNCIELIRESIRPAAHKNFGRWNILYQYVWPNPPDIVARHTWDSQLDFVSDFWSLRNAWMYDQLYNRKSIPGVR